MSTPFKRIMDSVRPDLPGAIDDVIRIAVYLACLQFFRESNAWREEIGFTLMPGKDTAYITPSAGRIARLLTVVGEGGRGVRGAFMAERDLLRMPFKANQPEKYTATVALRVSDPVSRDSFPIVPYDVIEQYMDDLIHGILARMMSQQSKPYTNLTLAQYHQIKFRSGISRAKVSKETGDTFGSASWRFPSNF